MLTKKHLPLLVFLVASIVEVTAPIFGMNHLHIFFKPMIMIGLVGFYWVMSSNRSFLFMLALLFCWLGDVLLIFASTDELFFMGGLAGFLIGHLLYIICYRTFQDPSRSNELLGSQKVRFSFPIILYGTGLVSILYSSLGGLKIPVMIYALAITIMAITALLRYGRTTQKSFVLIFIGAILFLISDSILALNKFKHPFDSASFWIMITYCTAQFLIVQGVLFHEKSKA
jgi:uncharacterized membrane protein YhhN